MSGWRHPSSCTASESDGKVFLVFFERDLFYGIIEYIDETVAGDRFFYEEIDFFSLDFTFHIAVGSVPDVTGEAVFSGTLDGFAAESDALDDPSVDDEISLHNFIV